MPYINHPDVLGLADKLNPDLIAVFSQLELVETQLANKRKEMQDIALQSAEQDLASAEETLRRVTLELDAHKAKSDAFSSSFATFESLRRELEELLRETPAS